jgi:hypothetical protein
MEGGEGGRRLLVSEAKSGFVKPKLDKPFCPAPSKHVDAHSICVKNIPKVWQKSQLEGLFSNYGEIVFVNLVQNDKYDTSLGVVGFKQPVSQQMAI